MIDKKHITGIILAGGKSSRMGSDKGLMMLNNKPFIQHIVEALQPLVNEVIIVSNNADYDIFKLKRILAFVLSRDLPTGYQVFEQAGVDEGLTWEVIEDVGQLPRQHGYLEAVLREFLEPHRGVVFLAQHSHQAG